MNILHITNGLSEGGVDSFLFSISKEMLKAGNSVSILILDKNKVELKEKFEAEGIRIIVGKFRQQYNLFNIGLINAFLPKFDIIHAHLFPVQLYLVLANQILIKRKIIITTEHNTLNHRRKRILLRYLDRWFYKKYDFIIGISESATLHLKKWINKSWIDDKCITITNGIDLNFFSSATPIRREEINIPQDACLLVMVARFFDQKDQGTVIRALKFLPDNVHIVFVGSGDSISIFRKLTFDLDVVSRVHFLGGRKDVAQILKIAKIGILSSNWEGFGLSVVEYMASGIPAIASDVDGVREVIGNNNLLFPVGDAELLASRIMDLLTDTNKYNEMCLYCKKQAEKFAIESTSESYLNLYKKALNKHYEI